MRRCCWLLASVVGACGAVSCSDTNQTSFSDVNEMGGAQTATIGGKPTGAGESTTIGTELGGQPLTTGASSGGATSTAGVSAGGEVQAGAGGSGDFAMGGLANESAGQAGAAGERQFRTAGETCVACGAVQCSSLLQTCEQNPECAPWLACLTTCDSEACASACDGAFPDIARVYYGVYGCLCSSCETACGVAETCKKKCVVDDVLPSSATEPDTLAATGLYSAMAGAPTDVEPSLAPYVHRYAPLYPLWADGAGKERYIYVPGCATIDTQDMNHWQFPVGTRLWKDFSVDGKHVETRMIHRYGSGPSDWLFATYGWDASKPNDPSAAVAVLHGLPDANGTLHDIPDPWECGACHGKLPDRPLGFSAFQLSHAGDGLTMQKLSDWGWLSVPARNGFTVPGTPVEQAALGYLHANCGGCHNSYGEIPRENPMRLRLLVAQTNYAQTDAVLTTIGVPTINSYPELHGKPRIDPQAPANSAIYLRMTNRDQYPMPPIATKVPDTDGGVAVVSAWIHSIPKQ